MGIGGAGFPAPVAPLGQAHGAVDLSALTDNNDDSNFQHRFIMVAKFRVEEITLNAMAIQVQQVVDGERDEVNVPIPMGDETVIAPSIQGPGCMKCGTLWSPEVHGQLCEVGDDGARRPVSNLLVANQQLVVAERQL